MTAKTSTSKTKVESKKETSKKETPKKAVSTKKEVKKTDKPVSEKTVEKKTAKKVTDKTTAEKTVEKEITEKTVEKPAVDKPSTAKKPQTMEELLAMSSSKLVVPKRGESIEGVVVSKNKRTLVIDFGAKTQGTVSGKEYDFAIDFITSLKVGDKASAIVLSTEGNNGQTILSMKGAASDAKWKVFEDAMESEAELEAKGLEVNRGGLIVVVNGVRGFVPSSQFGRQYVGKINQLKGAIFKVKAIEVNRESNRLIFSERHVSEAKELSQKEQALHNVEEGKTYRGVVSGVMHFGLFVTVEIPVEDLKKKTEKKDDDSTEASEKDENVGYVEGLVHISEISWEKVNNPRDYHQVGDSINIKVLGIDKKTNKLNLSIKQLSDDPWTTIGDSYPIGTSFTGKVTRVETFGVFVNVENGVDGLIHNSKLDANRQLKVGEEVTVTVESLSPEQRRMSLSMVLTEAPMGYK